MIDLPQCDCPSTLDIDHINLECPRTWALLRTGLTRGVFQLESPLGRHWVKKCQVNSINDLSDLVALLRPGPMESMVGKRNLPEIYAARKTANEPIEYIHPGLEPILKDTFGILTYQEQAISIASNLAGFTLEESDLLRRSMGKKLPEEMAKVKDLFLTKAKKHGVLNDTQATEIFDWIEKSQRYSFNKCLHPETRINLSNGYMTVKQLYLRIKEGEDIFGYSADISNPRPNVAFPIYDRYAISNRVINVWPSNISRSVYLKLKSGLECTSADNHRFPVLQNGLIRVENIRAIDIDIGDSLLVVNLVTKTINYDEIVYIESNPTNELYFDVEMDCPLHNLVINNGILTCNSHSVSYAMLSYWSAYCKAHFPVQFFHSWLNFAKWKMDPVAETKDLVQDAKNFDVKVLPPRMLDFKADVYSTENTVRFGLLSVKKVGQTVFDKMITEKDNLPADYGEITSWSWLKFLVLFADKVRSDGLRNIINVGGLDNYDLPRRRLEFELDQWDILSNKEKEWAKLHYAEFNDLRSLIDQCSKPRKEGGGACNINRTKRLQDIIKIIDSPPTALKDDVYTVANLEKSLLGVSLTYDELFLCKKPENTWTCAKLVKKKPTDKFYLSGKIESIRDYTIKSGKSMGREMSFLALADGTGLTDNIVAFPNIRERFCPELVEGNTILICADYNHEKNSVVINEVWNI